MMNDGNDRLIPQLISVKLRSLQAQVDIAKIILNSSNLILRFRIVATQGQIYKEDGYKY